MTGRSGVRRTGSRVQGEQGTRRKRTWHATDWSQGMLHLAQFEAADIDDRFGMLSTRRTCVLEHHAQQASSLYYTISDFFVEVRFEGPDHHPCLSMTAFRMHDALCDRMLLHLEHDIDHDDLRTSN